MRRVWLPVLGLVLVCGSAFAQTFEAGIVADESVCDDLMFATPGLYGLCIAYCEAIECDVDAENAQQCENARTQILRNYNRKKQPWDPDMPCLPSVDCFCFTQQEVEALLGGLLPGNGRITCWEEDPGASDSYWGAAAARVDHPRLETSFFVAFDNDGGGCEYRDAGGDSRFAEYLSREQGHDGDAWACFNNIYQACLNTGGCTFDTAPCPSYPAPSP